MCLFFRLASRNKKRNVRYQLIRNDGSWITDHHEVGLEIRTNLCNLLTISPNTTLPLNYFSALLSKLNDTMSNLLCLPLNLKLKMLYGALALTRSEDGLHAIIYKKKNWENTKNKITNSICNIFQTWSIEKDWCKTLLCLIPKTENPSTVNHFLHWACAPLTIKS